jgi:acyl-CoA thioester hydrolase
MRRARVNCAPLAGASRAPSESRRAGERFGVARQGGRVVHGGMTDFPITVRFAVQWVEMDAYGHVNNGRYFSWFEAARIAYMTRVGLVTPEMKRPEGAVGPIVAATNAEFLKPVAFPADLVVGARVVRIGNTSFTMEYAVEDAKSGVRHARGGAVVVLLRYPEHTKVSVPAELRAAIEALEGRTLG